MTIIRIGDDFEDESPDKIGALLRDHFGDLLYVLYCMKPGETIDVHCLSCGPSPYKDAISLGVLAGEFEPFENHERATVCMTELGEEVQRRILQELKGDLK